MATTWYKRIGIAVVALTVIAGSVFAYRSFVPNEEPVAGDTNFWKLISGVLQPVVSTWNMQAPANLRFDGEIQPDGATCSNGQILKRTGVNDWDCAADATGAAGSVASNSLDFDELVDSMTLDGALTIASATYGIDWTHTAFTNAAGNISMWTNDSGYLTSIASETFWDTAYGWGDHSLAGYITDGNTGWDNTYNFITLASLSATSPIAYNNGTGAISVAANYSIPLTASASAWEVLKDGGPYLTGNQTITLSGGVTGSGTTAITTTVASESYWDLAYAYKNVGHLPLAGGTLTGNLFGTNASLSGNFELAAASTFQGAGLTDCDADAQTLGWDATTRLFTCGADSTGGGGASIGVSNGGAFTNVTSISFDANMFDVTFPAEALVKLDWTNGPASRSATQTITGQWGFSLNPTFATGYSLPITASLSAWEGFYDTPSGRITDGTGLTWSTNTLNVDDIYALTAGDTFTGDIFGTNASFSGSVELTGSGRFVGALTGNVTGNASTATALASNPDDCSSNQFAIGIAANGNLTCSALADADVPNDITITALGNYLPLAGGTLTGNLFGTNASLSSKLEVGTGNQFTVTGATGNTVIAGTLNLTGLGTFGAMTATGVIDFGGATSFEIPNGAGGTTVDAAGEVTFDTASNSFNGFNGTAEKVLARAQKCFVMNVNSPNAKKQFGGKKFNDPFTITSISPIASGTGSITWQLRHGLAGSVTTNLFSVAKSASTSSYPTYTAFADATLDDGEVLDIQISSQSATLQSLAVNVCGEYNP